jgi:hypothetical protein
MNGDRAHELRGAVDRDRQRLDAAVATLKRAAVAELGLGRHLARSPWAWLLAAGAAGAWLGFRRTKR